MSLGNTFLTLKVPLSTSDPFIGQPTCCKVLGGGGGGVYHGKLFIIFTGIAIPVFHSEMIS